MRLADVMDDIAIRLRSIPSFRTVFEWPTGALTPPAAVVAYPENYNPNLTYNRGAAHIVLPVWVVVGKAHERSSRNLLSDLVDGTGEGSVIAVLQKDGYSAFSSLTVVNIDFATFTGGDSPYLAAIFDCDILGSGR